MTIWQLPVLFIILAALVPMIWRKPILGVYVLVATSATIEAFPLGFPDSLTDYIPFYWNLNNSAGLPISANPAEIVIGVTILATLAARAAQRTSGPTARGQLPPEQPRRRWSNLRRAYLVFLLVVLFAEAHGLVNGGTFNLTLWEMRPQVYGFVVFLVASSLVTERRQVAWLAGILLAGAAFKGGVGFYRYFVTMHQALGNEESILGHEDSYFLALFVVGTVVAMIWGRRRNIVLPLVAVAPLVLVTMFENRRRAAELALVGALVVIVALGIRFEPAIRKQLAIAAAVFTLALAAFVSINWNTQNGIASQVVRPVRTAMGQVDYRDYLSDLYRLNENANIKATYSASPLIGTGFGRPMLIVFPMADISENYPLWQYIPHNSLLWVAMRMGIVGMAAFWALIGTIILEGIRALRSQEDRLLRAAAAFTLAAVVAELLVGYTDVQLEAYRNMIFFGVLVGLIEALPRLRTAPAAQEEPVRLRAGVPALRTAPQGAGLASSR